MGFEKRCPKCDAGHSFYACADTECPSGGHLAPGGEAMQPDIQAQDGEVRVVSETGGEKGSKPARFDLIPAQQLWRLAEHYGVGAEKYSDDNYRKGYPWKLSIAALERHLSAFKAGEDIDPETGSLHIIAVAWHAFTLAEFYDVHPEYDTRLKTVDQRGMRG